MNTTPSNSKNVLGSDVEIKGTLKFTGELTFEGKLDGEINTDGILNLGDSAVITGNINAQSVVVRGKITEAEHLAGVTKNQNLPWKLRDHALFISYAPAAAPRYACSIVMEHGAIGHPHVEMVRDILLYAQQRDPLKKTPAYPVNAASAADRVQAT